MMRKTSQSINNPFKITQVKESKDNFPRQSLSFTNTIRTLNHNKSEDQSELNIKSSIVLRKPDLKKNLTDLRPNDDIEIFLNSKKRISNSTKTSPKFQEVSTNASFSDTVDMLTESISTSEFSSNCKKNYCVNPKDSENCFVVESYLNVHKLNKVANALVTFYNTRLMKNNEIKSIVLDFVHTKDDKFYLLNTNEYIPESRSIKINVKFRSKSDDCLKTINKTIKTIPRVELVRSVLKLELQKTDEIFLGHKQKSLMDIYERSKKPTRKIGNIKDIKDFSNIKHSNYFSKSSSNLDSSYKDMPNKLPRLESSKSFWDDKSHEATRKHLPDINDKFDDLELSSKICQPNRKEIINKYGGYEF